MSTTPKSATDAKRLPTPEPIKKAGADDLKSTVSAEIELLTKVGKGIQDKAEAFKKDAGPMLHSYKNKIKNELQSVKPNAEAMQKAALSQLQDVSPLQESDFSFVFSMYTWLVVCFLAFALAQIPGMMFSPLIGLFTGNFLMFLNIWIMAPAYFLTYAIRSNEADSITVLLAAVTMGAGSGYWWSGMSLAFWFPHAFLAATGFSIAAGFVRSQARPAFFGICGGIAMGLYFVFGLISSGFQFTYLLLALFHVAAFIVDLQLKIGRNRAGKMMKPEVEQILTIIIYSFLVHLAYLAFGVSNDAVVAAPPAAA